MSSIRTLSILSLLLALPLVPVATAAPDYCQQYGICGGPIVSTDDGVCAGFGGPYGGEAVCVREDGDVCVITAGSFWYREHCASEYLG